MKIICPKCKHEQEIKWAINGTGVEYISIGYKCPNCSKKFLIGIGLQKGGKQTDFIINELEEEPKITGNPDYIG
jgi:DNA-directed RNA polymerase subunit RPC12/RpoP